MPVPTGRGYALLALAAVTYLAGRLVGTWELYLLAFAFLAMVLISWLSVVITGRKIVVTRTLVPDRPMAGDECEIVSHVKNESLLPGPQLTLRNDLVGLASGVGDWEVEGLRPRGEKILKSPIGRANRGVHFLPPAQAVVEDPLGVARALHRTGVPLTATVPPRLTFLDSCALFPDVGLRHDWSGRRGLLASGASEFRGIRPHQPGEPLSHIDWKSTAKTGVLMLREMEEPAGADITVLLDGTAAELVGEAPESNFELAVRAAGSIADFAIRAGRGVSLLCHEHSWRQVRLTADGAGRRALLQALAETQAHASAPLVTALKHLRTGGPHLLRAQSVTVVAISLESRLVRALIDLHAEGARLAFLYVVGPSFGETSNVQVPSLLPFLPPRRSNRTASADAASHRPPPDGSSHETLEDLTDTALGVEARSLLLSLSSAGIPCLTLSRGDDLVRRLSLVRLRRWDVAGAMGAHGEVSAQ